MTAHITCLQRGHRRVKVATDAAAYHNDGVVGHFVQKCFAIPTLNMAVYSAGAANALSFVTNEIDSRFRTFDAAMAGIESAVEDLVANGDVAAYTRDCPRPSFSLSIAGLSESRGPEAWSIGILRR